MTGVTFPRRLTWEDADGAGRVRVYLAELGVWRLVALVDAQNLLDNGAAALEGPEDAPLEAAPRTVAHYANLRGGREWRAWRRASA